MLIAAAAQAADQIEPLDADFLEYLANMESDDDDWTLLDEADHEPASQDSGSERAEKATHRKVKEEAAKPAVEQR